MPNIAKKIDNSIQPSGAVKNNATINIMDLAIMDHDNDQNLNNLMSEIMNINLPISYKVERCKLIIETFKAGLDVFKEHDHV